MRKKQVKPEMQAPEVKENWTMAREGEKKKREMEWGGKPIFSSLKIFTTRIHPSSKVGSVKSQKLEIYKEVLNSKCLLHV